MNCVQVEKIGQKVYIKCGKCGKVLVSNDQEYSLAKIKRNELMSISSCEHFEVVMTGNEVEIMLKQS